MTAVIGAGALPRDAVVMTTNITSAAALLAEPLDLAVVHAASASQTVFRLRPIMKQGTASSIPETWTRFVSLEDARRAVKSMYHDDRVLRAVIVIDDAPPRFVEWVER